MISLETLGGSVQTRTDYLHKLTDLLLALFVGGLKGSASTQATQYIEGFFFFLGGGGAYGSRGS